MAACTPTPTATLFETSVFTTESLSTSLSTSLQTVGATTSTFTITSCAVSLTGTLTVCPDPVVQTSLSTNPGTVNTITNQVIITVPVIETQVIPTATLFASCPDQTTPPNTATFNNIPSTPPSQVSMTLSPSIVTPPVSTIVSSIQSTLPNGQITVLVSTFTSTPPASTLFVSAPVSPGLNQSGSSSTRASANLGPIIGGVLGGFFGLLAVVAAFLCYRRSRQWDDIFEKDAGHGIGDDDERSFNMSQKVEPAPYHYGLVGHTNSPSLSPPTSPRSHLAPIPYQPSQYSYHSRVSSSTGASVRSRESQVPLNAGAGVADIVPDIGGSGLPNSYLYGGRRGSLQKDVPLLSRPLTAPASTGPGSGERRQSFSTTTVVSPTSPRLPPSAFYVTNGFPSEPGPSRQQQRPSSAGASTSASAVANLPKRERQHKRTRSVQPQSPPVIVHTDGGRVVDDLVSPISPVQLDSTSSAIATSDDTLGQPPAYTKS